MSVIPPIQKILEKMFLSQIIPTIRPKKFHIPGLFNSELYKHQINNFYTWSWRILKSGAWLAFSFGVKSYTSHKNEISGVVKWGNGT